MLARAMSDKITHINTDQLEVAEVYESFLTSNARNSERTAVEYQNRVEEFFRIVFLRTSNL